MVPVYRLRWNLTIEEAVGEFSLDVPLPFAIKLRSCSAEMVQSFPTSGNASKVEVRSKFVD